MVNTPAEGQSGVLDEHGEGAHNSGFYEAGFPQKVIFCSVTSVRNGRYGEGKRGEFQTQGTRT